MRIILTYQAVSRSTHIFEVLVQQETIGIVWNVGDRWHASEHNMADRSIDEATRDEAALRLQTRGATAA